MADKFFLNVITVTKKGDENVQFGLYNSPAEVLQNFWKDVTQADLPNFREPTIFKLVPFWRNEIVGYIENNKFVKT